MIISESEELEHLEQLVWLEKPATPEQEGWFERPATPEQQQWFERTEMQIQEQPGWTQWPETSGQPERIEASQREPLPTPECNSIRPDIIGDKNVSAEPYLAEMVKVNLSKKKNFGTQYTPKMKCFCVNLHSVSPSAFATEHEVALRVHRAPN